MPYYINNECIGCTICAKKCPVPCIWGGSVGEWAKTKEFHIINPPDCIECGVCASYCPVDCIQNEMGKIEPKIEAKQRPVAVVREDNCTGCEWCVDVCPFDCIYPSPGNTAAYLGRVEVNEKTCVGCKLCEEVCVQKDAIVILYPDGSYADRVGVDCKTTYMGPDRMPNQPQLKRL